MGNDQDKDMAYDSHIKLGLQHINNEYFGDIIMKGKLLYPAVVIKTETVPGKYTFYSIKNSINLKEGSHYIYFELDGSLKCIGKIDLNIENISRLENLMRRLKPTITYSDDVSNKFELLSSLDLVHTLEIDI